MYFPPLYGLLYIIWPIVYYLVNINAKMMQVTLIAMVGCVLYDSDDGCDDDDGPQHRTGQHAKYIVNIRCAIAIIMALTFTSAVAAVHCHLYNIYCNAYIYVELCRTKCLW